jgi:Flp pilus assembly protein TadB
MDIIIAILAVILLTWIFHSLWVGLVTFILVCFAIYAYRKANRRL